MANWKKLDSAKRKYEAADKKAEKTLMEGLEPTEVIYVNDDDWVLIQAQLDRKDRTPELDAVIKKYAFKEVE